MLNRIVLNSRVKFVCKGKTYFFAFGSKRKCKLRREGTLANTSLSRQNQDFVLDISHALFYGYQVWVRAL